ncbi:Winged helix DNA-binding domain-containing protein [Streptomyces sp. Ag82_O1-12]|uniref:winged helix DNA-binding domain-containing protein n=1 Tax=unclassified Streptomyces TaxID=2593676 RepID=UPI000BD7A09D|nr:MULTISPECIES: winged helix DNA-binding domain-containing protein [unclassified Streptomyces]SMQ21086.1 Winged helix DNA-binding domain-containing protein [Streptomyces sp. Ag82_O1-12]SOD49705.1 Winged helix DNA-binding domain-containing protein [Streptomyces sp. Ag82_G6-1]
MDITAQELNRATLGRQLLLGREAMEPGEAVRRVVALQAQHAASPYVGLWNRLAGFAPAELDAAFSGRAVVKATLMRITLHAVHADDYQVFREAMQQTLYASRLGYRFAAAGLTPADGQALVPELLDFADRPRTAAEVRDWLAERVGEERKAGAWWGLKAYAPLLHVPTGGPWSFDARSSFVAARTGPVPEGRETVTEALNHLVLRYLAGFGPASVADVAQFAMVPRAPVRRALLALDDAVERLRGPDGTVLYGVPGASRPPADTPAPPRLMAMWDSVLLAHADRSRVIPPAYRRLVIRVNSDVLPTLLVDGRVAGVWRALDGGIEATAFHDLPTAAWNGLAEEAASLTALLAGRDTEVYRRYHHWWPKLPDGQVRLLKG